MISKTLFDYWTCLIVSYIGRCSNKIQLLTFRSQFFSYTVSLFRKPCRFLKQLSLPDRRSVTLSCCAFFGDSLFLYILSPSQRYLCHVEAVKSRPVYLIRDVIPISDPYRSFSTTLLLCLWYFSSFYPATFLLDGSRIPHLNTVE
jgi:hypothetical protein